MNEPGLRFRSMPPSIMLWVTAALLFALASCAASNDTPDSCNDGLVLCGGVCVDTKEDADNCGTCDQACPEGRACHEGVCGQGGAGGGGGAGGEGGEENHCGEGQTECAGNCSNLQTDPLHCGSCVTACEAGQLCTDGVCGCPAGQTDCDGACLDLQSDTTHCGACDVRCKGNQLCTAGACGCREGLTDCDGTCAELDISPLHCGSCETACSPRALCREGACSCIVGPYEDLGSTTPQTVTGTTVDGGSGYDLSCVAAGSTEKVYMFTAPADGTFSFDTSGSSFDTAIGLFSSTSCAELGCNDDTSGQQSRVMTTLHTGDQALLVVTGFNAAAGDFTLAINQGALPVCPSGTIDPALPLPQTVTGNTALLGDAIGPSCGTAGTPDASFTFVAPYDGRFVFDTYGSSYDTVLDLLDGDCSGSSLACNNDFLGSQSRVTATLRAGQTVIAVVDGRNGAVGPFTLNVSDYVTPPCPAFDLGSTVPQTVSGDTTGLENTVIEPCGYEDGVDLAYSFTAPADGLYIFEATSSSWTSVLHAHDSSCGGPALACDPSSRGSTSRIQLLLTAGQSIVIVVDGYGSWSSGPFTLTVTEAPAPPCPTTDLGSTVPQTVTGSTIGLPNVLETTCGGFNSPEATYSFTAPEAGTYIFDTVGSSFDTILHLHNGACSAPALACNDNWTGSQSQVGVDLAAGQTVIAMVDGAYEVSGSYTLNIRQFTGGGTCSTRIDLGSTVPQVVTGSTVGQPSSVESICSSPESTADMLYSFTAPADATYIFDTSGSTFDTVLQLFNGDCAGDVLGCNNDAGSPQSEVTVDLVAGQTVTIDVDGNGRESGDFTLHVGQFIGNGTCAIPIELDPTVPSTVLGNTAAQPNSATPTCGSSSAHDVVYTFTAPSDGLFVFDTAGSSFDTVLQVFDNTCAGAPRACNDNAGDPSSRVVVDLRAGETVIVVVDGVDANVGDYELNVSLFDPLGTCALPIDLGSTVPQTATGNTAALIDSTVPSCAYSDGAPEAAFTFTAPTTGDFVIDTFGSDFDTILDIRGGAECSSPALQCNDDDGSVQSRVDLSLTAGQQIVIVVDGYSANSGNFTLNITPG